MAGMSTTWQATFAMKATTVRLSARLPLQLDEIIQKPALYLYCLISLVTSHVNHYNQHPLVLKSL